MKARSFGAVDLFGLPSGDAPSVLCASLHGLHAKALRKELLGIRSADVVRRPSVKRALIDGTEVDSVRMRPLQGQTTTPEHIRFLHARALAASLGVALIHTEDGLRVAPLGELAEVGLIVRGEVDPSARPTQPGASGISDPRLFGVTHREHLTFCATVDTEGEKRLVLPIATRTSDPSGLLYELLLPIERPLDFAFSGEPEIHGDGPLEVPREVLATLLQPMLVGMLQDELRASSDDEAERITEAPTATHIVDPLIDEILLSRPLLLSVGGRWTCAFAKRGPRFTVSGPFAASMAICDGAILVGHLPLGDEAFEEARCWAARGDVSEANEAFAPRAFASLEGDLDGLATRLRALAEAEPFFPKETLDVALLLDGTD